MPITVAWIRVAFNRSVRGNRHGPGVAFASISGEINITNGACVPLDDVYGMPMFEP